MSAPKSLPVRPSLESLRKQAKRLERDITAREPAAITRARTQLPNAELPLSLRDAQLVVAREYGYAGWQDLTADVARRSGEGLAWAASRAEQLIHDNDIAALKRLIADYPALLTWGEERGGVLAIATGSYGDSYESWQEEHFTRIECAEFLLDAGAVISPDVPEGMLRARTRALLDLFRRRGLLPRRLKYFAALGDLDGVQATMTDNRTVVNEAFMVACGYKQAAIATLLLDRCISLDPELGRNIDAWGSRAAFVDFIITNGVSADDAPPDPHSPWRSFIKHRVARTVQDNNPAELARLLDESPWLRGDSCIEFQARLFEVAMMSKHPDIVHDLLTLDLALLKRDPAPPSRAIEFALTYAKARFIPQLLRIWEPEDTLPFAAGTGDLAAVKRWFNDDGEPALGSPARHLPGPQASAIAEHETRPPTVQRVLDTALAYACLNNHFDVADFLLAHGADINTRWCSHEPASILHELVWYANYEAMQFLIDRGIDMTIHDFRWNATAEGWARYAANDEKLATWLAEQAARQRARAR